VEFAGNRIQIKSIAMTLLAAFFAGRINLFEGTFPAAIAFISVMLAVSTIYIYLVPVLLAAMLTYLGQGIIVYGDFLAVIATGLFFLFFHQRKFSIHQRTVITVTIMVISNCFYYYADHILYFISLEILLKEALAIMIYIRAFNLLARLIYTGTSALRISKEKVEMALGIIGISFVGSVGIGDIIFPVWIFVIAAVLLNYSVQSAFTLMALSGIFWYCQGENNWEIFAAFFTALLVGWYAAMTVERRYQRTIIAAALFIAAGIFQGSYNSMLVYGIAISMMMFIGVPQTFFTRAFCIFESRFMPEYSTEKDLRHLAVQTDLQKKRDAFLELGQMYSKNFRDKEIISYQFTGMSRTLDSLLKDLHQMPMETEPETQVLAIAVGQASYAFEAVSGDSMAAFPFNRHDVALMISDGMGKGHRAAEESTLVVETLSKLLQAGFDVDLAMKTINSILMAGTQNERFATVDLAIVDRKKGRLKIFKMGAATTFIKHDGRISMLKRQALPAGITQGLELEYIDIRLKKGDILIMVSDGVTECDRKDPGCDWLRQRLLEIKTKDPETIAELIVNKAAEKYGIRERDDLSVMVACVK